MCTGTGTVNIYGDLSDNAQVNIGCGCRRHSRRRFSAWWSMFVLRSILRRIVVLRSNTASAADLASLAKRVGNLENRPVIDTSQFVTRGELENALAAAQQTVRYVRVRRNHPFAWLLGLFGFAAGLIGSYAEGEHLRLVYPTANNPAWFALFMVAGTFVVTAVAIGVGFIIDVVRNDVSEVEMSEAGTR